MNQKLNVLSKAGLTKENLAEASTIDKHNNVFKELIEESDITANQNDMPSCSTDANESNEQNNKSKKTPSPPAAKKSQPAKQLISKQLSGDMKQLKIDQLMNFDLAQLEDSPPNKKIKF